MSRLIYPTSMIYLWVKYLRSAKMSSTTARNRTTNVRKIKIIVIIASLINSIISSIEKIY
jgi:hypothetical protein